MNIALMHVAIDLGLQNNARFSNRNTTPEEKDIIINEETLLLLDSVFKDKPQRPATFEENTFDAEITRLYKVSVELTTSDHKTYSETSEIPSNLHHLITLRAMRLLGTPVDKLEINTMYRALVATKYGNTWYKVGETFTTGSSDLFFYGKVEQLDKAYFPVRLISSENIHTMLKSYYNRTKNTNPVVELFANKLRAYQDKFIVNGIELTYSRFPIKVNYQTSTDSDLPENIQEWLINKVILRIANATDQSQQKIQNIKTETL